MSDVTSDEAVDEPPTGVLLDSCFRQIEFAGILTNAPNPSLAGKFIDFMLSPEFQEDIPLNMFVFPARSDAALPDAFVEHTEIPATPASLPPGIIDTNRECWIEEWTEIMRS